MSNSDYYDKYISMFKTELETLSDEIGIPMDSDVNRGSVFEHWVTRKFFGYDDDKAREYVIGGSDDRGIDVGIVPESLEPICLIQCKFSEGIYENPNLIFNKDPVTQLEVGFNDLINEINEGNDGFKNLLHEYKERKDDIEKGKIIIRKIVFVTGTLNDRAKKLARKKGIEIEFYEISDILDFLKNMNSYFENSPESISLSVLDHNYIIRKNRRNEIRAIMLPLHVLTIYKLVKKYGDSLFTQNLRLRLRATRKEAIGFKIKDKVIKLLQSTDSKDEFYFEVLNNGLSITCNQINMPFNALDIKDVDDSALRYNGELSIALTQPQIVNGCQSSWAVHDAVKYLLFNDNRNESELLSKKVYIWVKIVSAADSKQKEEITYTSNNQNPINPMDFKANDDVHKEISEKLKNDEVIPAIFYEHKRGLWDSFINNPINQPELLKFKIGTTRSYRRIGIEEFGQLSMAILNKPEIARAFKTSIFTEEPNYKMAFNLKALDNSEEGNLNWQEAIVFALAIKKIANVINTLYKNKIALHYENFASNRSNYPTIDDYKKEKYTFYDSTELVRYWNYLLITLLTNIINEIRTDKRKLFMELFDITDENLINMLFREKDLKKQFILNTDLSSNEIIKYNDENCCEKLRLVSKWCESLSELISDVMLKIKSTNERSITSTKNFIEQQVETRSKIIIHIKNIVLTSSIKRKLYFPISLEELNQISGID